MNYFGLALIAIGVVYFIYNCKVKNQISMYFHGKIKLINNEAEFLRMQFIVGILNSEMLVLTGLIFFLLYRSNNIPVLILPTPALILHFNNYLFIRLASKWGIIVK